MPVTPTYPGVYVQEVPSGVRTITGVATSVAAFIDYFTRGPMNRAVQIFNQGDFEREFGGLNARSEGSYGIQQFFLNGGTQAWVVRVARARSFATAEVLIDNALSAAAPADPAAAAALIVRAASPGIWGNQLGVRVDPVAGRFNLSITEYGVVNNRLMPVRQEVFRNLTMRATDPVTGADEPLFAETVVNDANTGSKLVRIDARGTDPPLGNGTFSGRIAANAIPAITGTIAVDVEIDVPGATNPNRAVTSGPAPTGPGIARLAEALQTAIRLAKPADPAFADALVDVVNEVDAAGAVTHHRLRALAGAGGPAMRVIFRTVAGDPTATRLQLATNADTVRVTRSGAHAGGTVNITTATPELQVTSGAFNATVQLAGLAVNPATPLAAVAGAVQAAIRGAPGAPAALTGATVVVAGERLFVIPSGGAADEITFADTASANTHAGVLRLVAPGAVILTATRSGAHAANPDIPAGATVSATVGGTSGSGALGVPAGTGTTIANIAGPLQAALRGMVGAGGDAALGEAVVLVVGNRLVVVPGGAPSANQLAFANAGSSTVADTLLLTNQATANIQEYRLGVQANSGFIADSAQIAATVGADGDPPDAAALIGDAVNKTGLNALDEVDLFNLLCLPRAAQIGGTGNLTAGESQSVIARALAYCQRRRAFLILDTPTGVDEVPEIRNYLTTLERNNYAALFYPRVRVPDPLNAFRLRSMGASGTMAGLFARTDANRGVWKAPAGTEATLRNVSELDDNLTDDENGVLNPIGVNCLRTLPLIGRVSWGARTLEGADQLASEWKYIPVRRLALFIEESLYRGVQWAVFEPNDEPLWSQLRLNVGAFMANLYRQGAFQGNTPDKAYLVKCDAETTTQNDINLGIVNVVVGFAPLKPAEFVILTIKQLAGQIQT